MRINANFIFHIIYVQKKLCSLYKNESTKKYLYTHAYLRVHQGLTFSLQSS